MKSGSRSPSPGSLNFDNINAPQIELTNTLVLTNVTDFSPEGLTVLREAVDDVSPLVHWGPLKSFGRVVAVFQSVQDAVRVRMELDGLASDDEHVMRIFFGEHTQLYNEQGAYVTGDVEHLQLPDKGKLFFISPPPSPPVGWESQLEASPNTDTGVPAHELLTKLSELAAPKLSLDTAAAALSPADSTASADSASSSLSRSSTGNGRVLLDANVLEDGNASPSIVIDDYSSSGLDALVPRRSLAGLRTERPPIEV
ncbi:Calcipressin-domain-containing protein [Dipodascopsis tothii]|uniref:Calcipressin-domain-containing protein n=1 Tax=Dipodascopsis tothii TaxID=44089 RepID=UPI0034CD96C4